MLFFYKFKSSLSVVVYWMASILLLSAYLFSVCELVLNICRKYRWWATIWTFCVCSWTNRVIVHVKYFLLLGRQLLILSSSTISWIHHSKSHASWNKNVSSLSVVWWHNCSFYHVVVVNCSVDSSMGAILTIVCHISAVICSNCSFLIVTIQLLNIKASTSIVIS